MWEHSDKRFVYQSDDIIAKQVLQRRWQGRGGRRRLRNTRKRDLENVDGRFHQAPLEEDGGSSMRQSWMETRGRLTMFH